MGGEIGESRAGGLGRALGERGGDEGFHGDGGAVGPVAVDGGAGDAGAGGERFDSDGGEAAFGEEGAGGVEDGGADGGVAGTARGFRD